MRENEIEKMSTETQSKQILEYLEQGNAITPIEALNKFQCFRLGARVWDLKEQGHQIKSEMIKLDNGKRVAQYSLIQFTVKEAC